MKKLLTKLFMLSILPLLHVGCGDDDSAGGEPLAAEITGEAAVSAFRNTTVTLTIETATTGSGFTLTANGTEITIGADGTATFPVEVPATDAVGTTYTVDFLLSNGVVEDTFESVVTLVAGPGLVEGANLDPLVTTFDEFTSVTATTLISSDDILDTYNSVGGFQIGGSADGAGMVVNPSTGNFELLVNFEDHYAVGRITLDQDLTPLKGDYLLNSSVSDFARQCSATMWESAIHGGSEEIFISASETWHNVNKGIDPFAATPTPDEPARRFDAMGQFGFENAVPLPQNAYPGSTVVIGGDDDYGFFSDGGGGSVTLYLSTSGDADLDNGGAYVLRLDNDNDGAINGEPADESDLLVGTEYAVEFVLLDPTDLTTAEEWDQASIAVNALEFVRVEDIDYGKGSDAANRTIYIAVTGRGPGRGTPNDWGTGYKLVLNETDPTKGTLTKILSGNEDEMVTNNTGTILSELQSPDNICVTENFIYWQEDPNSFDRNHQAYIWQSDLNGGNFKRVLQIDLDDDLDVVNGTSADSDGFNGEFGAMFDISDKVGEEGTFILCLQPHYWTNPDYAGIDGHDNGLGQPDTFAPREDLQGSQIVVLRGLPR